MVTERAERAWVLYFLIVPALTLGILGLTIVAREPFPTLLMPGFSGASDLGDVEYIERKVFVIGNEPSDVIRVTTIEFAGIDFTQSQASPLINGIIRESDDPDEELLRWVHERLASLVPSQRCGQAVSLDVENIELDVGSTELTVQETLASHDLGVLRCSR